MSETPEAPRRGLSGLIAARAQAKIDKANADAERTKQERLDVLEAERKALELEPLRIQAEAAREAEAERVEKKMREADAEHKAAIQEMEREADAAEKAERAERRSRLTEGLICAPIMSGIGSAWYGQVQWWGSAGIGWDTPMAVAAATAVELTAISMGALAHRARVQDGDKGTIERAMMWSAVGFASVTNAMHSGHIETGALSILGAVAWEIYSRRKYRSTHRDELAPARPKFGAARWLRFLPWTAHAWSVAVRDRIPAECPDVALDTARKEIEARRTARAARRSPVRWWQRRRFRKDVGTAITAHRTAEQEYATKARQDLVEMTAVVDTLFGGERRTSPGTAPQDATAAPRTPHRSDELRSDWHGDVDVVMTDAPAEAWYPASAEVLRWEEAQDTAPAEVPHRAAEAEVIDFAAPRRSTPRKPRTAPATRPAGVVLGKLDMTPDRMGDLVEKALAADNEAGKRLGYRQLISPLGVTEGLAREIRDAADAAVPSA